MSDEPDWARVIKYLYENNGSTQFSHKSDDYDEGTTVNDEQTVYEPLHARTVELANIEPATPENGYEITEFLVETGMAERSIGEDDLVLSLTSKGFDVAHDREQTKQDRSTDQALVVLTFALVGVNFVPLLPFPDLRAAALAVVVLLLFVVFDRISLLDF